MPNYGLVINSKFKPFSYQEMLAPVNASTVAHQALENAYNELEVKAGMLDNILKQSALAYNEDDALYQQYTQYMNDLNSVAEALSKEGLSPQSRSQALQLNKRFSADIIPIQEAITRKNTMDKIQLEMLAKDPTTMFSRRASTTPLKAFYDNSNLGFDSYSGTLLAKQAADVANNIAKDILRTTNERVDTYTKAIVEQAGWTLNEFRTALKEKDSDKGQLLSSITNSILNASGLSNWDNYNEIQDSAKDWITQGLSKIVGPSTIKTYADQEAILRRQHSDRMNELREKIAIDADKKGRGYQTKTIGTAITNPEGQKALATVNGVTYGKDKKTGEWFTIEMDFSQPKLSLFNSAPTRTPKRINADEKTTELLEKRFSTVTGQNFDLQTQEIPYRTIRPTDYDNVLASLNNMGPQNTYYASVDEKSNVVLKSQDEVDVPEKDNIKSASIEILGEKPVIVINTKDGESIIYKFDSLELETEGLYNDMRQRQTEYDNETDEAKKSNKFWDNVNRNNQDIDLVLDDIMELLTVYNTEEVKAN